jgi:hypothetical protein
LYLYIYKTYIHSKVHLVLGIMITLLMCHFTFLPFDVKVREGQLLHRVERNSILALICMLWAGVVFIMNVDQLCTSELCIYVNNSLAILVILVNALLLLYGTNLFVYFFCKRNHLFEKIEKFQIRKRMASLRNAGIRRISSIGFRETHGEHKSDQKAIGKGLENAETANAVIEMHKMNGFEERNNSYETINPVLKSLPSSLFHKNNSLIEKATTN